MNVLTADWKHSKDLGILILRIVLGIVLFYGHGFDKLSVIFSGAEIQFMDPIGVGAVTSFYMAAFAEGICALLLIFGLFTRFATAILVLNFIVIFIFHAFIAGDGFSVLELRFLYLFGFLALLITGPGKFSLDALVFKPKAA